jgi:nucleoside-diphosphate-sugar epimerase
MKTSTNYMLTGVTGLLGRNVLFEIIKQHFDDLTGIKIFLLGRSTKENNLSTRIFDIIENDGLDYLNIDKNGDNDLRNTLHSIIHCINFELEGNNDLLSPADENLLKNHHVDYFFHIASHTDFRDTEIVKKKLWSVNVDGTMRVLQLAQKIKVNHFIYTGSAYACGETSGKVAPDYINFNQKFRNPYELSKLEAEVSVRKFSEQNPWMKTKFFRPSTICGRLIEQKTGAISKFDVFYAWMFFFLRCKERMFKETDLNKTLFMKCRVTYNLNSGLNIVPADYAAKAMYKLTINNTSDNSFHLVNESETNHDFYISAMTKAINVEGLHQVNHQPTNDLNELEAVYYKTVGAIFTPYITSAPIYFTRPDIDGELECPEVDSENFYKLLKYALDNRAK